MIEIESQFLASPFLTHIMHDVVPLHYLSSGHCAEVVQIVGSPEQVQRVREMGIVAGAEVKMVRSGTPCIIRTGGQTLCLRGTELLRVLVRPGVLA